MLSMRRLRLTALGLSLAVSYSLPAQAQAQVEVSVDDSVEHQTWFGFGATHETLVYGGIGDVLSVSQRQRAVQALFGEVKLTTGQIPTVFEAPQSSTLENFFGKQANDNTDAAVRSTSGFFLGLGDTFKTKVVDVAGGVSDLYPDVKISTKWASKWLGSLLGSDYQKYLDECAEQALAGIDYFKTTYGVAPRYAMLFNEPTSGNGELSGASTATVADVVKRTGQRLAAAGYAKVGLVVPGEETEEHSLDVATAIMNDADAAKYVGAIAYHTYPYGSSYSYVPNILSDSGSGAPNASRIQIRKQLKDLAAVHGVPLWMTEVSHAYFQQDNVTASDFRVARGRAIHIHDELVYADVSAYFGMNSMWDSKSQAAHFGTDGSEMLTAEHDTIVLVEQAKDAVTITGMGRAIGHYARFIHRGAKRVDATSNNSLLLVSAFRDAGRLVLVVVNNAQTKANLHVTVSGAALGASVDGEQSTAVAYWKALDAFAPTSSKDFSLAVPAESITTVEAAPAGAGGTGSAGGLGGAGSVGGSTAGGATAGGVAAGGAGAGGIAAGVAGANVGGAEAVGPSPGVGGGAGGASGAASSGVGATAETDGGVGAATAGSSAAAMSSGADGGCGCRAASGQPASSLAYVSVLVGWGLLHRRRGRVAR